MLIIMSGLPATGKSTLSCLLAQKRRAVHVRVDTIESALVNLGTEPGPAGYDIAFGVARDNLTLGLTVIVDSVNPNQLTRELWRNVATETGSVYQEVCVICSSRLEHKKRVEARRAAYLASASTKPTRKNTWLPPTWQDVTERQLEPWDTTPIILDTAGRSPAESCAELSNFLSS